MPDRVIRDELLTSERYWSVGIEAQQLFIHLLLNADSLSRFSGKNFTVRMACYPGHQRNPEMVEKLLSDLHDADLIRLYMVNGERFIFIPRYKQRLRYLTSDYPEPPQEINDINDLVNKKSDSSRSTVRLAPLEVKRREVKPSRATRAAPDDGADVRRATWQAYSDAYEFRHGAAPIRDAKANSAIKAFCKSVPSSECPQVAAFYVQNNNSFYVSKKHPPTLLAADAAKLRTEWVTGNQITQSEAIQADKTAARRSVFVDLITEAKKHEQSSK